MCHLVHYIKKIIAGSLFILSLYIFATFFTFHYTCNRSLSKSDCTCNESKKCSKNIVFDGDKMKRLAKHRWPMLGAKATFGKVLGKKNA